MVLLPFKFGILRFKPIDDVDVIFLLILIIRWWITQSEQIRTAEYTRTFVCQTHKLNALTISM